ncbi:MFS transporter [Bacillus carboniphilus]|uniref:MFS transporter n=1 Tax=Bacillus carboniphilus TaxID=86663 RepID=UPI0035320588
MWAKNELTIRKLFLFTFTIVFFNTWVWQVGLLLSLTEVSSNSKEFYSALQGVFGAIVILTNLVLPIFFKNLTMKSYLIGGIVWGLGIAYLGFFNQPLHFFIGVIIVGIGLPISGLSRVYLIQTIVPEQKMGRAFSSNAFLLYLANTLSLSLFGLLSLIFSIRQLMIFSGLIIILSSLIGLLYTMAQPKLSWRFSINLFK